MIWIFCELWRTFFWWKNATREKNDDPFNKYSHKTQYNETLGWTQCQQKKALCNSNANTNCISAYFNPIKYLIVQLFGKFNCFRLATRTREMDNLIRMIFGHSAEQLNCENWQNLCQWRPHDFDHFYKSNQWRYEKKPMNRVKVQGKCISCFIFIWLWIKRESISIHLMLI